MSWQPPLRPNREQAKKQPETWLEQFAANDELLLYFTAFLGVALPGIVYFIYHKAHGAYMRYAKVSERGGGMCVLFEKKEAARQKEEDARSEMRVFHAAGDNEGCERLAKRIGEGLQAHTQPLESCKPEHFAMFKGICIFVLDCHRGELPKECDWFLDWLEDVAADERRRKVCTIKDHRFAILSMDSDDKSGKFNKAAHTLSKRLRILDAKEMLDIEEINTDADDDVNDDQFAEWTKDLMDAILRNLPGGEELDDGGMTETETESESEDKKDK